MTKGNATRSSRGQRTICVPISEERYLQIINAPHEFRRTLDELFRQMPELFPANFAEGYQLKDDRRSGPAPTKVLLQQGLPSGSSRSNHNCVAS